jgi:hypothetical protein
MNDQRKNDDEIIQKAEFMNKISPVHKLRKSKKYYFTITLVTIGATPAVFTI